MILLYIIIGLALLLFVLSIFAPKTYVVERTIYIERPLEEVYDFLRFLRNQEEWVKRKHQDPDMKKTYSGEDGKIGFQFTWDSKIKEVGAGQETITVLEHNDVIYTKLEYHRPIKSESTTFMRMLSVGDTATEVTWGITGDIHTPYNAVLLFVNMDKQLGKSYEEDLSNLKRILELDGTDEEE